MATRVSLAELAAAGFVLHSAEAAAIVLDVCRQLERGTIRGIPSTHVIRLTPEGAVMTEGPITTDQPPIAKAAQLLNDLLPPFDAPPAFRVPGGLRLIVARALGALDLPPFVSLEEFCAAIGRFAVDDLATSARNLYRAWELAKTPRTLTISDLRRARRATGLSLRDISSACGVSPGLLRELEWGYLKNWRNDAVGRTWLSGYAKASGLDEQLVTSIVVPMLEEADPQPRRISSGDVEPVALIRSGPHALVPAAPLVQPERRRRWAPWLAAASAASLAIIGMVVMLAWPHPTVQARIESTAPAYAARVPVAAAVATRTPDAVPAVRHAVEKPHVSKARTNVKRTSTAGHKPPSKPNFFKRQLLRIIIK